MKRLSGYWGSRKFLLLSVAVIVVAALSPLLVNSAQAGRGWSVRETELNANASRLGAVQPSAQDIEGKEVVNIGVYILSVGNLDTTTGTYRIDFFLNFICDTIPCDPSEFDIMNAADLPSVQDQTDPEVRGKEFYYRVNTRLQSNLDLRDFPFDQHILEIEIEDKNKTDEQFIYVPVDSLSGIDSNVRVAGWDLAPEITGEVEEHRYDVYNESYSRARYYIEIYHPWFSSFMKGLFAAIVIVMVGMLSFAMRHDATTDRLALTSSTLVGAILYHLTLTSTIPPVGYLTFADSYMLMNYVFVFMALGITVALMLFMDSNEVQKAISLHKQTRLLVPVGWVIASIILTVAQFVTF